MIRLKFGLFTELTRQINDEMENVIVVVVFQYQNLNDEVHFHYVHELIVLVHSYEKNHQNVTSKIKISFHREKSLNIHT